MDNILNTEEIKQLIPNRYPIYYVDKIVELKPGEYIKGIKNVTINEDFFQGHFPGNPVVPNMLIVEMLAQVGSVLILKSEQFLGRTAYIGGMDKVHFLHDTKPGDVLELNFSIEKIRGTVGVATAYATVNNEKNVECVFTFIVGNN
ncbi:3-hydroxyacyl-ACP dehydratase FabZ [Enterococcus gallinarum]|uniref:3-hydroxyacyl-ACP dehydratase FabZ n=1 Tax=Enterococcus gallinarum TaxID=1353 RepID=UPI002DBEA3D6|nr:3-hydroxyacyl-ACP dehydratase FabZ [Enterococcus gallinarum]MEB5970144.1 3-hydroxyacyl-ACP dehydratase FabZ [Enterococcus gallinarum]